MKRCLTQTKAGKESNGKQKTKGKIVDTCPHISLIAVNANELNTTIDDKDVVLKKNTLARM